MEAFLLYFVLGSGFGFLVAAVCGIRRLTAASLDDFSQSGDI